MKIIVFSAVVSVLGNATSQCLYNDGKPYDRDSTVAYALFGYDKLCFAPI